MITLHHLENSRSQRILWLLEEMGIEYEVKRYKRDPQTRLAPPELKAVHPLGKSPVITDGERVVAETGFIIDYLLEQHGNGKLLPAAGTDEHLRYRYWLYAGEGSVMPPLVMYTVFGAIEKPPVPFFIRPISKLISAQVKKKYLDPTLEAHLQQMESELDKSQWFAGNELTGADIMLIYPLEAAQARAGLEKYPNLNAFIERVHARPAYQKALEIGGPYELLT
ncbi:glutathione S-transferase [Chloroflexi bacterium TSY]|nr:glutathione S-transferase [Chloroflexi bacterium TSY]